MNRITYSIGPATMIKGLIFICCLFLLACQKLDLKTIDGNGVKLKDTNGRWLVLNVWADWCSHCREEMSELNALNKQGHIRVIGHDFDAEKGQALKDKIKDLGIEFPTIVDNPFLILSVKPPKMLPATYIINPEGALIDTIYGHKTQEEITRYVKESQDL